MPPLSFFKVEGTGNDFILFPQPHTLSPEQIKFLCDRHFGIGADGLMLLRQETRESIHLSFFNADASQASMCGNALRAVAAYLSTVEHVDRATVHLGGRAHSVGKVSTGRFSASFPVVDSIHGPHTDLGRNLGDAYYLFTGTDHVVSEVAHLDDYDVHALGSFIRYHTAFAPKGTNANFVEFHPPNRLRIRTYERGVEGETLSCGSGSVAAALVGKHLGKLSGEVIDIENRSPHPVQIRIVESHLPFQTVELIGPARVVFRGEIEL